MSNVQGFPLFRTIGQFFRRQSPLTRRATLLLVLCLGLGAIAFAWFRPQSPGSSTSPAAAMSQTQVLRIGYQKSSTVLNLLRSQQVLEKRLQPEGVTVEWKEFTAGLPMVQALTDSIDFAWAGETPPVFAQAAGVPLVYVAYEPLGGAAEAILVPSDSPILTVADLKGKKVAVFKGSNTHYLLVKALEEVGLQYSDVETVFMPPNEAGSALAQGSVAAWSIWDPLQAVAEKTMDVRILRDGLGLTNNYGMYLANQKFAQENPDLVRVFLEELDKMTKWAENNRGYVVDFLSTELGIDKAAMEQAELRHRYEAQPITDDVVASQQQIADTFYKLGLIDKEIKVADAIWR